MPVPTNQIPDTRTDGYDLFQGAALVYSSLLAVAILYSNRFFYHDDAYITLRYARNFLDGHGIVWNPGEYVQGYTSFLHLFLVSTFGGFGIDLVWASRVIGIMAFATLPGVLVFHLRSSRQPGPANMLRHIPVLLVVSSAPLVIWSIGGLEGTLFAALAGTGFLSFLAALERPDNPRGFVWSGLLLGLTVLARPDGLIFAGVCTFWIIAMLRSRSPRILAAFTIPCFSLVAFHAVWQFSYYHDLVPNTLYAKADHISIQRIITGCVYCAKYALRPPFLPILTGVLVFYAIRLNKWDTRMTFSALFIAGYCILIIMVGGDHMPASRLWLPLIVPLAQLMFLMLASIHVDVTKSGVVVLSSGVLILSSFQLLIQWTYGEDPASSVGTIVGRYISRAWPAGSLVALNTAGSTPYYANRHRYIDMLGLNDAHIAHRHIDKTELMWQERPGHLKGDGAYVLSRDPGYIIIGPAQGATIAHPSFLSDLEMSRDARFYQRYEVHRVRLDKDGHETDGDGITFTYYRNIRQEKP